jgi:phosphoribosyl 1,2-cyclic phosphodiesterase
MGNDKRDVAATFWGVRGSTPCANKENIDYGGNTTCVQIHLPDADEVLILDSGTGIRNLGNKLMERSGKIRGRIFITHPHWDHIQGFPFFKPIYGSRNHFEIHMPEQVNGGCKDVLSGHLTETFFPVTLDMIDANIEYITQPEAQMQYEGYRVEYMLANHTIKTAIYKIQVDDKQIVFCPDNELDPQKEKPDPEFYPKLNAFFQDVDLLIHDGQYNREMYNERRGWGHSAWQEVVNLAQQAGVKNLFLTHHDPDSDDQMLRQLDEKLQKQFGGEFESIQLAREGETISLA